VTLIFFEPGAAHFTFPPFKWCRLRGYRLAPESMSRRMSRVADCQVITVGPDWAFTETMLPDPVIPAW
jgi:hypothetical protein